MKSSRAVPVWRALHTAPMTPVIQGSVIQGYGCNVPLTVLRVST
jgi:hypothetical protein